jgi:hypothetical protein
VNERSKLFRRTILLIDKKLQLKFVAIFGAFSAALTAWCGFVCYVAWQQSDSGVAAAIPVENPMRATYFWWFLVGTIAMGGLSAFLGLLLGHRIAGPAFVVGRWMNVLAGGEYPTIRALRVGDDLQGLHQGFANLVAALKRREEEEISVLTRAVADLQGQGPQAVGALAALKELAGRKQAALSPTRAAPALAAVDSAGQAPTGS